MKLNLCFAIVFILMSNYSIAQTKSSVSITFLFNGKPVCGHTITLKDDDKVLGKGVTSKEGVLKLDSVLIQYNVVDIYGYKYSRTGAKNWSLIKLIELDDSNTAIINMENYVKMVAKESKLSESLIITAWGVAESCN
ncbi:MAG: hypothetical protein JNM96_05875 [Bacteroidia bacterium]|nr:hypothetical protein [Bacteroidia bacterium]